MTTVYQRNMAAAKELSETFTSNPEPGPTVNEARFSFLTWSVCFEIKILQERHASIAFILHQVNKKKSKIYISLASKRLP